MKQVRICSITLIMLGIIFTLFTNTAFGKFSLDGIWNGNDVKLEVSNDNYLKFTINIYDNNNSQIFSISGIKINDNNTFYYHDNNIEVDGKFSTNNIVSGTFKTRLTLLHPIIKYWNASLTKNVDPIGNTNIIPETNKTEVPTIKELNTFSGHSAWVYSVAFSPDGKYALSGSADQTLKLWDVATGREIRSFNGHSDSVKAVTFSPDGQYILSGSDDGTLKLWEVSSGKEIRTFIGHSSWILSVAISPDGRYALSGSKDHNVKLWEINTGKELTTFTVSDSVNSVAFSPDGKYIAMGSDNWTIRVWELATGNLIRVLNNHPDSDISFVFSGKSGSIRSVAYSPDGQSILSGSGDQTVNLWDGNTGKLLKTMEGHANTVSAVAFSPNGKYIVSGSMDNTIKIWEPLTGKLMATLKGHTGWVNSVSFSPDSKYVLSGSCDQTLKLWDLTSLKLDL